MTNEITDYIRDNDTAYQNALVAFAKAQAEMGAAFKNSKNPFLKNKYADLTAIQNAVYPPFHANGFIIQQCPDRDELGTYVETILRHTSGGSFACKVYLEYKANDMQSMGGAITYARRYGLSALTGVPIEDDDGNMANGRTAPVSHKSLHRIDTPKKDRNDTPEQRGIKLMKFIETATADNFDAMFDKAFNLIKEIAETDKEFSDKISTAWENKSIELGMN